MLVGQDGMTFPPRVVPVIVFLPCLAIGLACPKTGDDRDGSMTSASDGAATMLDVSLRDSPNDATTRDLSGDALPFCPNKGCGTGACQCWEGTVCCFSGDNVAGCYPACACGNPLGCYRLDAARPVDAP